MEMEGREIRTGDAIATQYFRWPSRGGAWLGVVLLVAAVLLPVYLILTG